MDPPPPKNEIRGRPPPLCAGPGCSAVGLKSCARCQVTFYCGTACQKKHWPEHRKPCKVQTAVFLTCRPTEVTLCLFVSWQQKNKLLQKNFEASAGAPLKKTSSDAASVVTVAAAPAAAADAIQVEGSASDPLLSGTARTGTLVRIHGLTDELRRFNFDKVSVLLKTVLCVNSCGLFAREW